MKRKLKKVCSFLLSLNLMILGQLNFKIGAFDWKPMVMGAAGSTIAGMAPNVLYNLWYLIVSRCKRLHNHLNVKKYAGFKKPQEIINDLEKILKNEFEVKIYGQEKAKRQAFEALSGIVTRIDNIEKKNTDVKEVRGNIVYLIGPSGTGKTKLCYAIAKIFLKHPEKTVIFCHSESVTGEAELGTQLFKTITTKDIGEDRPKNIFTGSNGLVPKDEESHMLKHLLKWYEAVVIIDEYDKMKQKSAKPGSTMNIGGISVATGQKGEGEDRSADEILRSIASTGKYKFMNKEVDCSKILFLITTNETREELERNFGIGGTQGGGVQRLNVVEFEFLSLEACYRIVEDMIDEVTRVLVDENGLFKLKKLSFDENSKKLMAQYIFNDKVMQGRAKYKLEDKIYSLFSKDMGKEYNSEVNISYTYSPENNEGIFCKN